MLHNYQTMGVRLHKLFQFIDGFRSEYDLKGFLHVGIDYSVFLHVPKSHDKNLVYELYETRHVEDIKTNKSQLLAISKVPVGYLRQQLKTFLQELYKAKYEDDNVIPGTSVQTLREWQIDQQLAQQDNLVIPNKQKILKNVI